MDEVTLSIDSGAQSLLTGLLAFLMFSVSLGLKLPHFKELMERPKPIFYGLTAQLLGLPILTLILIYLLEPNSSIALGMIVVASCPGGNVSNFLTNISNGNIALSVTLTSIVSMTAVVLTPVSIIFWSGLNPSTAILIDEINLDVVAFITQTVLILGLPLVFGMVVAAKWPNVALIIGPFMRVGSFLIIIFFIIAMAINNHDLLINFGSIILPIVVLHNTLALFLGNVAGRLARRDKATTRAITFEVGIQNSGLGLVILLSQFQGLGGAAMITATWGLWHIVSGLSLATYYKYRDKNIGV